MSDTIRIEYSVPDGEFEVELDNFLDCHSSEEIESRIQELVDDEVRRNSVGYPENCFEVVTEIEVFLHECDLEEEDEDGDDEV